MSSAIASLFESRHPWTKDGALESGLGFSSFGSGGLLGIRGGMPRLPSFKVKKKKDTRTITVVLFIVIMFVFHILFLLFYSLCFSCLILFYSVCVSHFIFIVFILFVFHV